MTHLEKLIAIVPPPLQPVDAGTPEQWEAVEQELGTALPQDYKWLVNIYGVGWFANWICVYSPFSTSKLGFPLIQPGLWLWIGKVGTFPEYHHPFPVFPTQGGLLPWGTDDNAGPFCWLTEGEPADWTIVNLDNHYSEAYRQVSTNLTGLLAGWFSGEITGDWYPEDVFPMDRRVFTPGYRPQHSEEN